MSDIVERIDKELLKTGPLDLQVLTREAAAEITRLREQLAGTNLDIAEFQNTSQEDGYLLTQAIKERDRAIARLAAWKAEAKAWRKWCDIEPEAVISEPLLWQDVVNARAATDAIEKNAS